MSTVNGVYTVKRKKGTAVYISYMTPDGQVREKVDFVPGGLDFKERLKSAKRDAEHARNVRLVAMRKGKLDLPQGRRMLFRDFVTKHYAPELRARGIRGAKHEIRRVEKEALAKHFGSVPLDRISEYTVRNFVRKRQEKVGPGTINRDLGRLKNLWNYAKKMKLVSGDNPVSLVERLKEPQGRVRYLTEDEEDRLLEASPSHLREILEFALHTGIRQGACLRLRWEHVHWHRGQIEIPAELSKSKRRYHVAINEDVERVLRTRRAAGGEFVFGKSDGSRRISIRTAFENACERAGVEDFRFHDTRHDCATKIVSAGGTLWEAGQQLGHTTQQMTERYAHLQPEHLQRIANLTRRRKGAEVISFPSRETVKSRDGSA